MEALAYDIKRGFRTAPPTKPPPIKVTAPYSSRSSRPLEWTFKNLSHFIDAPKYAYFEPHPGNTNVFTLSSPHKAIYATNLEMASDPAGRGGRICTIEPAEPYTPVDRKESMEWIFKNAHILYRKLDENPKDFWANLGEQRPDKIVVLGVGTEDPRDDQWRASQGLVRYLTTELLERVYGGRTEGFQGIVWNDTRWDGTVRPWTKDHWQWQCEKFGKFAATVGGVTMKDSEVWNEVDEKTLVLVLGRYNPWRQLLGAWISREDWKWAPAGVLCVPFEEKGETPGSRDERDEDLGGEMEKRYHKWDYWDRAELWGGCVMFEKLAMYVKKGQSE